MNLDPSGLSFRAATSGDVSVMRRWLEAPHVSRWFTRDHADWLVELAAEPANAHPFVVLYEARPIGLVVWEFFADFPDVASLYGVDDASTINCDVFIGELEFVHRGLGGPIVKRFLDELAAREPHITRCVIDPHTANHDAIRAYGKAGFRWIRNAPDGDGSEVFLMELDVTSNRR